MLSQYLRAVFNLTRFTTSLILFLAIAIPLWFHLGDMQFAAFYALPILTACMNGFAINDISDIEADKINHPERPLPSNAISELSAVIFYYCLLAFTLLIIKIVIEAQFVYGYLAFLLGLMNYNYVIRHTPKFKNIYIALVGTTPFIILWQLIEGFAAKAPVIVALFFFILGREILMDVHDAKGDKDTLAKWLGLDKALILAFGCQIAGVAILLLSADSIMHYTAISFLFIFQMLTISLWYGKKNKTKVIKFTRIMFFGGIILLI